MGGKEPMTAIFEGLESVSPNLILHRQRMAGSADIRRAILLYNPDEMGACLCMVSCVTKSL